MNIKKISVFAVILAAAVAVMRSVQFIAFFDGETGFFRDNGLLTVIALVLVFLLPLGVAITAKVKKTLYGRTKFLRSFPAGILALVCGGFMVWGLKLFCDEHMLQSQRMAVTAMGISFRGPFMWATVGMVLFFVVSAVAWLSGKALFQRAKFLYLISVLWALFLILYVFIHHSISVLTTENLFLILLACSTAVAFMAQARFFADLNPQGKSLKLLVPFTLQAAVMMTSYAVSGLVIRLAGIHPKNEVSLYLEFIILAAGIYMFVVLFSLSFVPLAVPMKVSASAGKRYKVDIKRDL